MYSHTFNGQGSEQGRNSVPSLEENDLTLRDTPDSPLTIKVDTNPDGPAFPIGTCQSSKAGGVGGNARGSAAQCKFHKSLTQA